MMARRELKLDDVPLFAELAPEYGFGKVTIEIAVDDLDAVKRDGTTL
jgi:hypothetical protein